MPIGVLFSKWKASAVSSFAFQLTCVGIHNAGCWVCVVSGLCGHCLLLLFSQVPSLSTFFFACSLTQSQKVTLSVSYFSVRAITLITGQPFWKTRIMKAVLRSHLTPLTLVILSTPWSLSRLAGWTPSRYTRCQQLGWLCSKFHHPFFRIIKIKSVGSPENWRGRPRAVLGFVGDTQRQTNRAADLGPEGSSPFRSLLVFGVVLDHDVPCMSAGRLHS